MESHSATAVLARSAEQAAHFIEVNLQGSHRVVFKGDFETANLTYILSIVLPVRMTQTATPSKTKDYWAKNPGQVLSITVQGTGAEYMGMLTGPDRPAANKTDSDTCKKNLRLDKESDFFLVINGTTVKVARFKAQCHDGDAGGIFVPYYREYHYEDIEGALLYAMKRQCYVLVIEIGGTVPQGAIRTATEQEKQDYEKTFVAPIMENPKNRVVSVYCTACHKRYGTAVHDNDADLLEKGAVVKLKCLLCHQDVPHLLVVHLMNETDPGEQLKDYTSACATIVKNPANIKAFANEYKLLPKDQQQKVPKDFVPKK